MKLQNLTQDLPPADGSHNVSICIVTGPGGALFLDPSHLPLIKCKTRRRCLLKYVSLIWSEGRITALTLARGLFRVQAGVNQLHSFSLQWEGINNCKNSLLFAKKGLWCGEERARSVCRPAVNDSQTGNDSPPLSLSNFPRQGFG